MTYTPPRGRCNYKTSLMSPGCPCLRFMLHPVKAATSFECDGCNHHASFHSLENPAEDAILRKWEAEEKEQRGKMLDNTTARKRVKTGRIEEIEESEAVVGAAGRKRKRAVKAKGEEEDDLKVIEIVNATEVEEEGGGMLQRTMALFGADTTPYPTREKRASPVQRTRRGKKAAD